MIEYKNHTIEILHDPDPLNPREIGDNFAEILCFHRRYKIGDENRYSTPEELTQYALTSISLPVYMYDHSGIQLSTSPFSCPWDSGQVGFICVSEAKVREEFSKKRISSSLRKEIIESLKAEVKEYSDYLSGSCYGFVIKDSGQVEIDSCWGYYGEEYPIQAAKDIIDAIETGEL